MAVCNGRPGIDKWATLLVVVAFLLATPGPAAVGADADDAWRVLEPGADWRSVVFDRTPGEPPESPQATQSPLGLLPDLSAGARLWESRYEHSAAPGYGWAIAHDVATSHAGDRVYVAGESVQSGSWQKFATVAYETFTGRQLWESVYSGDTLYSEAATSIAVAPDDSRVYVTGHGQSQASGWDYTTIAYDSLTGDEIWISHYRGDLFWDWPTDITVSPDGERIYITGFSAIRSPWFFQYATVAYDAATGEQLWVATYSGGDDDLATALGLSADGATLFVSGPSKGTGDEYDYYTIAYDTATGTELWSARYDGLGSGSDAVTDLSVDPGGRYVYVSGESAGAAGRPEIATVAYDASTGAEVWVAHYQGAAQWYDRAEGIEVAPDGAAVYVTGWSVRPNSVVDYVTLAYDAVDGSVLWTAFYDGPGHDSDFAYDVVVDPSGQRVYITGQAWGAGTGYDFTTIAYDADDGGEVWVSTLNGIGGGRDYGRALALDPLGLRLFGTGFSRNLVGDLDYVTTAYLLDQDTVIEAVHELLP